MTATLPSILFVHDQYPGQFGPLAQFLHDEGWEVSFATLTENLPSAARYQMLGYTPHRAPSAQTHPYAQSYDRAVLTGQACARSCARAKDAGTLAPDIIISHTGPGSGLFLRDVFAGAFIVAYCEWWYRAPGVDTEYLAALEGQHAFNSLDDLILARSRNAAISAELLSADVGLCPTQFQADQFPESLRQKIKVSHDGVDTGFFKPLALGDALDDPENISLARIPKDALLVTYATRGMEPHRCFPHVFEAFSEIAKEQRDVFFVIAGENKVFYGSDQDRRINWLDRMKMSHPIPEDRLICPGTLSKSDYLWLLRRSSTHVYCTVPFVLSWSLLDAMAVGTPLVVSDVDPVREVMPEDAALFVNPSAECKLIHAISASLTDPVRGTTQARMTRARVQRDYNLTDILRVRRDWLLEGLRAKNGSPDAMHF